MSLKSRKAAIVSGGACLIVLSIGWSTYIHDAEISKRSQSLERARKLRQLALNIVSYHSEKGEYPASVPLAELSENGVDNAGVEYGIVTGRNGHQLFILQTKTEETQRGLSFGLPTAEAESPRSLKGLASKASLGDDGILQLKTAPAGSKLLLAPNCFFDQTDAFEFQDEPAETVIGDAGHIVCISSSRYRGQICEEFAVLHGCVRVFAGSESRKICPGEILILLP
ncbi:MAG: hypothetical protein QGF00_03360 [Planctomycetota bacterium]|jgi:hypothetical protein|nr:hypothetical protein [Planctomycetota bacterium]MDP7248616.1 hypothetical protein [Planctomycetota bacterium]